MTRSSALRLVPSAADAPTLRRADGHPYVRAMASGVDRSSSSVIEAVVTRFRALVRSVGARRGLVDADLDEVMQDVRIRLWQAQAAGKVLEELGSSYLYHVATTAALDLMRRRRSRAADRSDDVTEQRELPAITPSAQDDIEARELATQVDAALETLSLERRVAVRYHLAGYDRDDIARSLGWSDAKTRNLLYRGLDDLRKRLAAMGISPRRAR